MANTQTRKPVEKKRPNISWTIKPDNLTLIQWQKALRRQAAEDEQMICKETAPENYPGEYEVNNPSTRQTYKVVFRGDESPWNYCSCMDFKTSRLGTCKHIERVKMWVFQYSKPIYSQLPAYTSIYLSYANDRQVKIRIGQDHYEEYKQLASKYFDSNNVLLPQSFELYDQLIIEGMKIDPSFRFYQDAIDYIIEQNDNKFRQELVKECDEKTFDSLLSTKLYPYQKDGIRFAIEKGRSIIADEMGLGKTVQALATAELFRKKGLAQSVLIVCPTSLKYQWQKEIEKFVPNTQTLVIEGSPMKRMEHYANNVPYKIVSYNCVSNDIKMLGVIQSDVLIMDEVQRLKNWKTQISMSAKRIISDYAVILSGTPLENKLEELYTVMEYADNYCLSPYWQFKNDCILTDGNGKVIGYQNLNKIGAKVRTRLIRRTKKQVALQMPKRQDNNMLVAMTKEQQDIHDELKNSVAQLVFKWQKMRFLTEKDRHRLLLLLSQMRMVCDSTFILDQKTHFDTKIDETMNILQSVFESGNEKVVIFSQWERMTRLIAEELDKMQIGYEYLHGGVPSAKRKSLIDNFTDDEKCRVFLSTDAGSTGLNLQAASIVINLDLPWNPSVLEQRIARIYRIGQERNIQVINLISRGTIEEQMLGKLRFKSALFEGVLDNGADTIYLGDKSKFSMMMDSLSEVVSEDTLSTKVRYQDTEDNNLSDEPEKIEIEKEEKYNKEEPQDVLKQGVAFLSTLANTLQSPAKTQELVDTLVKTDEKTGQSHLEIPVPDKDTVKNIFNMIGKLFSR